MDDIKNFANNSKLGRKITICFSYPGAPCMIFPEKWLCPASLKEAAALQKQMARQVCFHDEFSSLEIIAGMDVSNNPRDPAQRIYASVVTLNADTLEIIETSNVVQQQRFPYVSGFLGFREAPALVEAFARLKHKPSLLFVDGHGISHPRGLGIASHIGVLLDCPAIGVAKSILVGKPMAALGLQAGAQTPLMWQDKIIAMLLRSKARSNPLIISVGHRVSLITAVALVQRYLRGYRLPEPTRQAHLAANLFRLAAKSS